METFFSIIVVLVDPGDFLTVVVLLVIGVGAEGFFAAVEAEVEFKGFLGAVTPSLDG